MDPESSFIRVERTFWTVWYYITGAVNRFFRTEPSNIVTNDPNSFQESAVNSEPADSGHTEGDDGRGEVTEERPHAADSPLSSSKPIASWELCTTDIDLESDEESRQFETQLSVGSERWRTGNDDAGLVIAEEAEEEEEEDKNRVWNLYTHQSETLQCDDDGDQTMMGSLNLRDDAIEEMEGSREEAGDEEETERTMTPDENKKSDDTVTIIHLKKEDYKMHNENKWALEAEDTEVKVCSITDLTLEEEDNMHVPEAAVHRNKGHSVVMLEEVENSDGVLQNKCDKGTKQVENQVSGCKELSDNDQDVRGDPGFATLQLNMAFDKSVIVSEDVEQQHVEPEQEEDIERVIEGSHDEDILTELIICTKEAVQNVITDGFTAAFTDDEQVDGAEDTKVQSRPRETHDVTTDISLNERFLNESQEEICSEEENTESHMGIACAAPLFTVKLEGETTLENISLGICETQTVVSQELNSPICEETQEGVPEYNNELGSDENITQRFPEVGDCEEIQTTQLQEEVERLGPESRENSGCSAGPDYLLVREQEGEELESTEDINKEHVGIMNITDIGSLQESETALAESPVQEPGLFLDEEEGKSLGHSMKTGIERSEKEAHTYIEGESDKTIKEVEDATEVCLVEFEIDERLSDSKGAAGDGNQTAGAVAAGKTDGFTDVLLTFFDSEAQEMTDTIFFKESVDAIDWDQNSNMTPTLLGDDIESEFLKLSVETEPQLIEACAAETQDAVTGVERTGRGVEEEAAANETQSKYELEILNLQLEENAAEPIKDADKKSESVLITKSELSTPVESLEARNQLSDEALEISNEEMLIDIEAADELMTTESEVKDLTLTSTQDVVKPVTSCSSSGDQDVTDEEILDLWIQTMQAEDAEDVKQAAPESGQQIDTKTDASNKEEVELSVEIEMEKELQVESNSGESGLLSDTDISSSTAESGFMDQSVSENCETQLLKSSSIDSFQGLYDILADVPELAGVSELSTLQSESKSQDVLMEQAAEAELSDLKEEESISETGFHPDSGAASSEARHQKQESDKSQEKTGEEHDDSTEAENGSHTGIGAEWKDAEERDVKSPTKMSALFKVEKTEVEDEPFEINATSSPGETKRTESGRSRSSSEASLEERTVSTESGPQDATWARSDKLLKLPLLDKPQPTCSEVSESSPELNKVDGIEQLTQSEDEVDASGLDFTAQRSRIALKNPRVRPPKDPRSLIHMPSVEPILSSHVPVKVPAGLPLGGLGIGIKLPGLGSGFPVLKKTGPAVKKENNPETLSQEHEAKAEDKSDPLKQDEAQHKPKWMPPRHPGFGNPLMSELKTKLKKPVSE
ncbi:uncharacterized protein LOC113135281 [Mastacembelus armatus]|uniref:uncharacterized protein LOC113135281 n=1 Tax=Mastacembelus armatus TaxID=205130 RepID=UPI000E463354|nr:uncharacterized protein LOC113135281 [Mastacembelus armatus]